MPAGVTSETLRVFGARGGRACTLTECPFPMGTPGNGGMTTAVLAAPPGSTLRVSVGGRGQSGAKKAHGSEGGLGGFGGGGVGGNFYAATGIDTHSGGGGGGGSFVSADDGTPLVVAGGGGGGAAVGCRRGDGPSYYGDGGYGGGLEGQAGSGAWPRDDPDHACAWGGGGGTQTSGGTTCPSSLGEIQPAHQGSFGRGGWGGAAGYFPSYIGAGGGGGGGYWGGAGGCGHGPGGGGGGGSGYLNTGSPWLRSGYFPPLTKSGNGTVIIQYTVAAPKFTSPAVTTFTAGRANTFHVTATGAPTPRFSLTGAPPWLSIDPATGVLTGTPPAGTSGTTLVGVRADNGVAPAAASSVRILVVDAPVITSAGTATFTIGRAGSFTVSATGVPTPTVSVDGAPSWLSFDPATGVLSGTAPAGSAGDHGLTITAANGVAPDATQAFTLRVARLPSTTTLAVSPATSTAGRPATLSAEVAGQSAPTGTVTFTAGSGVLGTVTLDGSGHAMLTTRALPAGSDRVVATYSGDARYAPSASSPVAITVSAPSTQRPTGSPTATATHGSPPATRAPNGAPPAMHGAGTTPPSAGAGALASTGVDAALSLATAGLLLAAGFCALAAARRRRRP